MAERALCVSWPSAHQPISFCAVGLLVNFNGVLLKNGLHRFIARGERPHPSETINAN
jgi:hypothetical protein